MSDKLNEITSHCSFWAIFMLWDKCNKGNPLRASAQISNGQTKKHWKRSHSFWRILFLSFLFYPSHPRCYSPSFHWNTSPKCLTPLLLKCTHNVIQVEQKSYLCCKFWFTSILLFCSLLYENFLCFYSEWLKSKI